MAGEQEQKMPVNKQRTNVSKHPISKAERNSRFDVERMAIF